MSKPIRIAIVAVLIILAVIVVFKSRDHQPPASGAGSADDAPITNAEQAE